MTQGSQQAITHVLQQDSKVLETLLEKLKQLKQVDRLLADHLESKLVAHCQVANLENNCLIVITDSAIWATQFRFQIPALLPKLREHPQLYHLKTISCKIRPKTHHKPHAVDEPFSMQRLSHQTAAMMVEIAKTIRHKELQAIMQRIAQNTAKNKEKS